LKQNDLDFIVSPDEVGDTLVLVMSATVSAAAAGKLFGFWMLKTTILKGFFFIFGIHLLGFKVSPPIENSQVWVISPGWGAKNHRNFSLFGLKLFCLIHLFCFIL
jgi:hypothetical protein